MTLPAARLICTNCGTGDDIIEVHVGMEDWPEFLVELKTGLEERFEDEEDWEWKEKWTRLFLQWWDGKYRDDDAYALALSLAFAIVEWEKLKKTRDIYRTFRSWFHEREIKSPQQSGNGQRYPKKAGFY